MMLTPAPFPLGAIVMGTNSCAVDTVGCHMVHVEPKDLIHLKFASERGFGPMDLDQIDISGDFPLQEVRDNTRNFEFCLEHIDDYFGPDSNLTCTVGKFPERHSPDYCWGGCPGALQEAMHIFKGYYPDVEREMKKVRYVVGRVDGPLDLDEDEKVIFVGDCTSWEGSIQGKKVKINSSYKTRREDDTLHTKSGDMLFKVAVSLWNCLKSRPRPYVRAKGCTVSVAEHVNYLSYLGKIKNVNFDPRMIIPYNIAYWRMRLGRLLGRLFG